MKPHKIWLVGILILLCILPTFAGCKKGIVQYTVKEYEDVVYKTVEDERLRLDILMPTVRKYLKNPVVFYFHGGAWVSGDKQAEMEFMKPAIDEIRKNGIAVVGVNYRFVSDQLKYPAPVIDCVDAICWAVKNASKYDFDTEKMGSWGMSAGGYLSLMTGFAYNQLGEGSNYTKYPFKLQFVVDLCGPAVFDVTSIDDYSEQAVEVMQNFIGGGYEANREQYLQASPSKYLSNNKPNLLIIHGESDEFVPISQSEKLLEEATKLGIQTELIKVKNATHTFYAADGGEISPTMDELFRRISNFIINNAT